MEINPSKRHKARRYAVQALYHWQLTDDAAADVIAFMMADINQNKTDLRYFEELVTQVVADKDSIDTAITPYLDRDLSSVDPVERAILRLATFELLSHPEIPYRVVINEAIELCKMFGAEDGHKYINGVMDKAAAKIRQIEFDSHKSKTIE